MSDAPAGKTSRPSSNGKGSFRRRKPSGKGPRAPKEKTEEKIAGPAETADGETAGAPKRERVEITPVPESLQGTNQTGTVVITIRNRKLNFGFISLAVGEKSQDPAVPRIYYNPSYISEKGLYLYRGYEVSFVVGKDEAGRTVAKDIALTENGKTIKITRDAEAEERRKTRSASAPAAAAPAPAKASAEEGNTEPKKRRNKNRKAAATAEGGEVKEKKERAPRPPRAEGEARPPRDRRTAEFDIKVEGDSSKTGTVTFQINQSIGRLKSIASKAVDASMDLSVYLVTPENPSGVFLTRAGLNSVGERGSLLLAPKRAGDNLEA
mmetsp:Transcript_42317/g.30989  ORF Transcript_42317/g.30989 Transcript_42317/m.30989 type:complete len:323 (-) Transcript_42317:185-1153(-)|eukprot:CAMPEP_0202959296 /NCGR_PEP_ID=MMETSP1396-20130829/3517_1 /ASSEMBLY_ACC=CAM_ASM_000872 /TAXON_ID= /ORGANISM="Pseudokeronopsis sp., Strain Brazil" /LENGTH=322 /DNA_ID=CAMNT_0049677791 /DNA_START=107 /DNA_END=1075 /DNA_ORIENTATION=-